MTRLYVVAEEAPDREVLERLLPGAARHLEVRVVEARGRRTAATILASSISATRNVPVLVVVNAHTLDEHSIGEASGDLEDLLWGSGAGMRLVMAVPDVAVALFHAPEVLERVAGVRLTERMRIEARFIRRAVLAEVVHLSGRFADETELVRAIGPEDARTLAQHPLIQTLEQNVRELLDCSPARQEMLRRTG